MFIRLTVANSWQHNLIIYMPVVGFADLFEFLPNDLKLFCFRIIILPLLLSWFISVLLNPFVGFDHLINLLWNRPAIKTLVFNPSVFNSISLGQEHNVCSSSEPHTNPGSCSVWNEHADFWVVGKLRMLRQ